MEKIETPVVAGVGGVAVLAALLSVFGGSGKDTAAPPEARAGADQQTQTTSIESTPLPNQEGPWRAICQEYAPYPLGSILPVTVAASGTKTLSTPKTTKEAGATGGDKIDFSKVNRGYKTIRQPGGDDEATEITVKSAAGDRKITVHKHSVGDLAGCIPPDQLPKIRFVVATLPDPDKTEMRLEFDRYVDALEKAAALRGYNYTGYWFPWRPDDKSPAPKTEDELEAQLLRKEEPGVLLFRKRDERLFVFVVGETATSGVDRMQMAQAIAYREQLLNKANVSTRDKLLIVGPHFSGALSSLGDVLASTAAIRDPRTQIVINSPDTASERLINAFQEACTADAPCSFRCNAGTQCSFHSVSLNSDQKNEVAERYLKSLGYDMEKVAELVEDESGFGNDESGLDAVKSSEDAHLRPASPFGLSLTYPRELSAVRTLSDKQSEQVAASGSKFLSLSSTPTTVKLSGGDALDRDRPFVYASDDEATEVSNALADDVRVLRQKRIDCVVIGASNPLDRIFLLEYFHDKLPNVRLVVQDADELEINHPQFSDLTGTITISSLPVIPVIVKLADAGGVSSAPHHLAFASAAAEAEFLSMAIVLEDDPVKEVSHQNGLAVSVVGETGFQFIPFRDKSLVEEKYLGDKDHSVELFGHGSSSDAKIRTNFSLQLEQTEHIPRAFMALCWVVYLFTFVHVIWAVRAEHPIADLKQRWCRQDPKPCTPLWAYGSHTGDATLDYGRIYNLFVLNNQIFLLNLLVLCAVPDLVSVPGSSFLHGLFLRLAWVGLLVTGVLVLFYGGEYFWRVAKGRNMLGWTYWLVTLWYLVAAAVFLVLWHSDAQKEWHRVLRLDDGISPVVPIAAVLFAWTLWGIVQVRRAKWVAYRKVDPIAPGTGKMSRLHEELQKEIVGIHGEIEQTSIKWPRMLALFVTVILTSWWQWTSLRGLEPDPESRGFIPFLIEDLFPNNFHGWFAMWGGIMLLATLIISAHQLYVIWRGLSRLLHRLENTSMKEAFEKLGLDDKVQIKIWDLGKAKMRFSEMFLTVKCLRYISGDKIASNAEAVLNDYEAAEFRDCQATQDQARDLHIALNQASFAAMHVLEGSSTVVRDSHLEAELRRYLALRFVTFIRYVLLQMRNLIWFIVYGYFLACLSVKLYSYQGGRSLADLLGVTFFIVLAMLGVMMTGILRNPMLRSLEDKGSNPAGALQVILHLVTVGGVPLLALLAWQFPWIGQIAFAWLRPLWSAIH